MELRGLREHQAVPLLGRTLARLNARRGDEAKARLIFEDCDTGQVSQHRVSHSLGEPRLASFAQGPDGLSIPKIGGEVDPGEGTTNNVPPPLALPGSFVLGGVALATEHEVGGVTQALAVVPEGLHPNPSLSFAPQK
ncbi:hypothetical protein GCM10010317_014620 [Streptomyces mirabilis]|nr:hypothetical protein GCM10010317_014620 [Streptomyces mirabilis]